MRKKYLALVSLCAGTMLLSACGNLGVALAIQSRKQRNDPIKVTKLRGKRIPLIIKV